jgi:hypothetical protein
LRYLQRLCRYWADDHDWQRAEARLNAWPQLTVEIGGLGIHRHRRSADHFTVFEQPALFVDEVRTFFRLVR